MSKPAKLSELIESLEFDSPEYHTKGIQDQWFRYRNEAMRDFARAWAQEHLGWEQSVAAYEDLYRSLLDGQERYT